MSDIHVKAKHGIKLLMGRQVAVQVLTFAGGVVLARILGPAQFGLYIISLFLVSTFALLGDFGLAASFVQRKNELTDRDLQVGFTLQQGLTSAVVVVILVTAPSLVHLYPKAPPQTVWLVRAMAFNLFLTSWRTMSALQLERHLRYDRLARVEVVEAVTYQSIAVGMALAGFGVWSYVAATLTQGLLGTILVYLAAPWRIRFAFDKDIAKSILRYGLPFQFQTLANSLGGWVTPLVVGKLIGSVGVGYLTWASSNGRKPLILTDIVMRVAFPHFSRIQDDKEEVERLLLRYLALLLLPAGLWLSVLFVAGRPLVSLMYSAKWLPAVPSLILYALAVQADVFSMVLTITLNALGKVTFATRLYAIRSIASVALSIPFVLLIGFSAVPAVYIVVVALGNLWLASGFGWTFIKRMALELAWLTLPIGFSSFVGFYASSLFVHLLPQAIAGTSVTIIVFCLVSIVAGPSWLKEAVQAKLRQQVVALGTIMQGA